MQFPEPRDPARRRVGQGVTLSSRGRRRGALGGAGGRRLPRGRKRPLRGGDIAPRPAGKPPFAVSPRSRALCGDAAGTQPRFGETRVSLPERRGARVTPLRGLRSGAPRSVREATAREAPHARAPGPESRRRPGLRPALPRANFCVGPARTPEPLAAEVRRRVHGSPGRLPPRPPPGRAPGRGGRPPGGGEPRTPDRLPAGPRPGASGRLASARASLAPSPSPASARSLPGSRPDAGSSRAAAAGAPRPREPRAGAAAGGREDGGPCGSHASAGVRS